MKSKAFRLIALVSITMMVLSATVPAMADDSPTPVDVSDLLIPDGPVTVDVAPALAQASGQVQVVVQLVDKPLVAADGKNAKQTGGNLTRRQERIYLGQLAQKQNTLMGQIQGLGGTEIARVSKALNAVIVSIEASQISSVAALENVRSIRPVRDYQLDLSVVRAYSGAADVENAGFDGTGVTVGVLDSGVDYTHKNLGGSGDPADYLAAYGASAGDPLNKSRDGLFPTAKVIEGYDFVGEAWPGGALSPDDDPIDCSPDVIGCGGGHGTHTSDIVAGHSTDDTHKGIAPGASLIVAKVCSSISTSCSGVAILQGIDFLLDPNGDGNLADAVDVISMSIGSSYGQQEDDSSEAANNAVTYGVVFVASAGNSADRPYIVGSPSTAPGVMSVAATFYPDAKLYLIAPPPAVTTPKGGVWQSWSALPAYVSAPLAYDTTSSATRIGCTNAAGGNPYAPGSHAGQILLIDRGTCAVSFKVSNAAAAGAVAAVIANNASQPTCDLPPSFSFGGGTPTIPGYVITLADGNSLKTTALGTTTTIDPATAAPLRGNMAAFSSRGPSYSTNSIKPDIGGVGTDILSAQVGTGTGETPFSGTSASAPVLSGSAALLVQKYPNRAPYEIKSVLMNTAEASIGLNPVACPVTGAPITRIGGGEVRVKRAFDSKTAAWDASAGSGSLSFGYQALVAPTTFLKTVTVRNYSNTRHTYQITSMFRYADDEASGAVTMSTPSSITVPANSSKNFKVNLQVEPSLLPVWTLNGGSRGGDGFRLQDVEFDGYIAIADATENIHLAWQILPHRAAEVTPASNSVTLSGGAGSLSLSNAGGAVDGRVDVFSLLGISGKIPPPALPQPGDNFAVVDLKSVGARLVGIGGGAFGVQFAMDTFGTRSHPNYPAEFDIYIDTNRDGNDDYVIFNLENGGFAVSGQNVVAAGPLPAGPFNAFFFTDADLDSGNAILTAPLSAIGLTAGTQFNFSVVACDNYFTGSCTDAITGMTYTLGTPRYVGGGIPSAGVPAGGSSTLSISAVSGGDVASPSQTGLLLMYRDGRVQREADQITVSP